MEKILNKIFRVDYRKKIKKENIEIVNPIRGKIIDLEDVSDEVFSGRILGDGFAIEPADDKVYSPVDGEVRVVFPTLHAVVIETYEGLEVLIHIGIDTVKLNGEGFKSHIEIGKTVKKGELLVSFDKDIILKNGKSLITPVIITNMDKVEKINNQYGQKNKGELVSKVKLKGEI